MKKLNELKVVVLKEDDVWVGQCLEYDIGAQGPDYDTMWSRLIAVINAEARESLARTGEEFKGIPPAPKYYHDAWNRQSVHMNVAPPAAGSQKHPAEYRVAVCA